MATRPQAGAIPVSRYINPNISLPSILRLFFSLIVAVSGSPISRRYNAAEDDGTAKPPDDPEFWLYIGIAIALVLGGGAFAGLTIALMGQDEIYLQVIATSGEGAERKNAAKVLKLLQRGKHWVLVTLLLSNVITNETLPIILDRSLGGGWPAVLSSTVLIVIFGEIVPQSVCVRFGLPIGAAMAPIVLLLMWIMSPVAWPTAKLLDYLLGKDHGTMYKKAGLKTLVTLHRTLGSSPDQRLNQDEVTIISSVLDLKDKPVGSIMTPMTDVFTLSANAVLDEQMMDMILSAGYSRIPIYEPENPGNFVGMLLVKLLITYDPEDAHRVRDFSLATLPETHPGTSCLDIVNFFQEGKSHMVLVSEYPGEPYGALGVLTLEDVIEELIGEEIIDESDVFIDVHKAIRRMAPAPRFRVQRGEVLTEPEPGTHTQEEGEMDEAQDAEEQKRAVRDAANAAAGSERVGKSPRLARSVTHAVGDAPGSATPSRKASLGDDLSRSPRHATFLMRRRSSSGNREPVRVRDNEPGMREKLKSLGPRNRADRPAQTRINTVKIKPGTTGVASIPEHKQLHLPADGENRAASPSSKQDPDGERQGLLDSPGGRSSQPEMTHPPVGRRYGTLDRTPYEPANRTKPYPAPRAQDNASADVYAIAPAESSQTHIETSSGFPKLVIDKINRRSPTPSPPSTPTSAPEDPIDHEENEPVGSLTQREDRERAMAQVYGAKPRSSRSSSHASAKKTTTARSGSITESTVELAGGMKKIVLETTSSNEHEENMDGAGAVNGGSGGQTGADGEAHAKKKRKKRAGKKKHHGGDASHDERDGIKE